MSARPRILVTAGNTREPIDRVRDWGNIFTGNTGLAIAQACASIGEVELLTSNRAHAGADPRLRIDHFTSHADLVALLDARMASGGYDAVFMTAAVADYHPAGVFSVLGRRVNADGTETWTVRDASAGKVSSAHQRIAFVGEPTAKIVDMFRSRWNHRGLLVKFKLEVGLSAQQLIAVAHKSRAASGADYLVANTLEMVSGEGAGAYLLSDAGAEWVARADLAARLARIVGSAPLRGTR